MTIQDTPAYRQKALPTLYVPPAVYREVPVSHVESITIYTHLNADNASPAGVAGLGVGVAYDEQATKFARFFRTLDRMERLDFNWDGYGAEAPNGKALYWAKAVLKSLLRANFLPAKVSPSVENGVTISFRSEGKYADVECFNDGTVLAVTSDGSGEPNVWNVPLNPEDIENATQYIQSFLEV